MRILVVDDVWEYLGSISRALVGAYEAVIAVSLEEARQKIDETIGLALLDVRLSEEIWPTMIGYSSCVGLRSSI